MEMPKLQIGNLIARNPIVQGGMGVRLSLAPLAAAVANEGGIGTISSIALGDLHASGKAYTDASRQALRREIEKARSLTSGVLAVNVMGALSNVADLVHTAVESGIRMIVFGAGLPMKLPAIASEPGVCLVPIISASRAAKLIMRSWKKQYNRTVDAFIIEGPLAGGHLGYSPEQLETPEAFSLERTLPEVLEAVKPYEDEYGHKIPVIVAGGIFDGEDIYRMLQLGASGVQMGTRFVATHECSASDEFKQAYLDATKEDISIVKSPVGLPGRALYNRFLKAVNEKGRQRIKCNYRCLATCKIKEAKYCIAQALLNSAAGDVDHGLMFCGTNVDRVNQVVSVKALVNELVGGWRQAVARRANSLLPR